MCYLRLSILASIIIPSLVFGFAGGDGTESSPYQISTPDHLEAVNDDPAAHYVMTNDINLSGRSYERAVIAPDTDYSDGNGYYKYEFDGTRFSGTFDGAGFRVLNLNIDSSLSEGDYPGHLGLFGRTDGAEIKNLGIEGVDIEGGDDSRYIGGMCGWNYDSRITDCYANGTVSGGDESQDFGGFCGVNYTGSITNCCSNVAVFGGDESSRIGGLCGYNYDNYGKITNCCANGTVSGGENSSHIGGLCGLNSNQAAIENSYADVSVSGHDILGGLCGNNNGSVKRCYATGSVSGGDDSYADNLGGLCGRSTYKIENSYATGSVSGGSESDNIGGICGNNYYGSIKNCYATGTVSGDNNIGGICGLNYNDSGVIENCFWDILTSGLYSSAEGTGITTFAMHRQITFTDAGWDYVNEDTNGMIDLWYQNPDDYPKLFWQAIPGDCNYDGYVGQNDILIMAEQWLDYSDRYNRLEADLNFDDYVDILDYSIFFENWLDAN
ncbi:GLUG motif-containing protein [Sedimentisphaera salicampi]|uniref:GLUG domain-containing protein n=1 Tax=Sedimentisphaera salicampi TaxID=1941349 RepID=A0A1W6LKA8_9BACT|nr:GLUG motif-containing protein [Sedimentisphaera salicampi]ARN56228.1 hypothetical protein STSP1_00604 [Sedimentisphaera salicampi]